MNINTRLQMILTDTSIDTVLPAIAQLNLPNWWLAGGAVRNTVWRSIFGEHCGLGIKDFDIAFFDIEGNRSQELAAKANLTEQFPHEQFDVKNQASFARWRLGARPYTSTEDGITDWLHTATAVGVRLDTQGQWQFFTPYGLDDLFAGIIRPTPAHTHNIDAHNKASGFLSKCPYLRLA
ncbi:nucleotidyltransferase family protein [Nostoc sp. FACHB-973]|uniref:Nucleotidyltransferase family protein n=1 Tax=Desmonostoc muscorum LEGE 12446 TaxID=1828758 RepID=A0A8J6ZUX6_DESMC|nr:nucleotidyltransferase family protein [Desmonostoc muscorum]MBD2516843.1 nucleotidyltransferase family protein [Nostoc sp. FACHB-973]MBX9257323.1 nucleotidyltransferase family protein [Desmonostoc muscorum CCALA 125]MCF2148627.1 nucleotidyltransferase family protein [Desmonostoc muscorum LEGE 12446]